MVHSTTYWRVRCIQDSSDEENTPPNVDQRGGQAETRPVKAASVASGSKDRSGAKKTTSVESDSSTGTATPPWVAPQHGVSLPNGVTSPVPPEAATDTASSTPPPTRNPLSPTTSSPVLLETPQSPPPPRPRPRPQLRERRSARQERRSAGGPYARRREQLQLPPSPKVDPSGFMRSSPPAATRVEHRAARPHDRFVPAQWHFALLTSVEQSNPLGTTFPAEPHFGWCDCNSPCRVGTCRNSLMQLYCNRNCCPYEGMCGNGLLESTKVRLARNARTRQLSVVATDDIESGEVFGQYLGELEHVSISPENAHETRATASS
ncbi:unnamed protein product [Phytophthora fragariaefolia]|uniref:Unnamed protein product n=1 Tax=Phytophthora fragariaefolia TaxID=1490495 RepID=A0A9W6XZY6_9STRA|nr:unnamed protein product [Phytophthora fragariaefolia]